MARKDDHVHKTNWSKSATETQGRYTVTYQEYYCSCQQYLGREEIRRVDNKK